jgi:hypothetical protein
MIRIAGLSIAARDDVAARLPSELSTWRWRGVCAAPIAAAGSTRTGRRPSTRSAIAAQRATPM